ncbi:hypothetical protein U1Q18_034384 [Sarracenia purpurea var. burkii]
MAVSKKPANPSSTLHPPYLQMIGEAISSLKDRTGSSQPAIAKFIEDKYDSLLPPNFKKILSVQLKKLVKSQKLHKIKNSYKISSSEKVKSEKLLKIKNSYEISSSEKVKLTSSTTKESQRKKIDVIKANPRVGATKKAAKKGEKTKRLSQIKTPEALKEKSAAKQVVKSAKKTVTGGKMKRLGQVKTPAAVKKKTMNKASTPAKRNASKSVKSLKPAPKKAST